jgi:uncharacterized lipoprotein YddW (UPF0748 family)
MEQQNILIRLPEVTTCKRIVKDIVKNYDVDAIHMDDYFYPYRIDGKEFPDEAAFKQYGNGFSKDDWRRSNCDRLLKCCSKQFVQQIECKIWN